MVLNKLFVHGNEEYLGKTQKPKELHWNLFHFLISMSSYQKIFEYKEVLCRNFEKNIINVSSNNQHMKSSDQFTIF